MGWTRVTVDGQRMWERDGERVREVPDESRSHRTAPEGDLSSGLLFIGALFGFFAGLIVGLAVMKAQMG